jgi:sugar phosphate isomerase/epimerase
MDRIGIDHLSVFGLPPVAFVNLAADLGCRHISISPSPIIPFNPHGYPPYSLTRDRALREETRATLRARGVSVSVGSGFLLGPETDVQAYADDLATLVELGARRINSVSMDRERLRGLDTLASLAEFAASFGLETMVEVVPGLLVDDLAAGLGAVRHVGRSDFRLLIDTMHVARGGARPADLAALDPSLVGYIQLCDAPLVPLIADYAEEVTLHRLAPGDGELPLRELLAALPRDVAIGLEIPMAGPAQAGVGPEARLRPCVEAARALLAQVAASQ